MAKARFPVKTLLAVGVSGILSIGGYMSYYTVEEGTVGIVKTFGKVTDVTLPGLHFKVPFRDTVHIMNTRTLGASVSFDSATQDQQRIQVVIDVQWSVAQNGSDQQRKAEAEGIYATYGSRDNFDASILDTRAGAITKAITGTYTLTEIITERGRIQEEIEVNLRKELSKFPITIEGIQAKQLDPSDEYRAAIEKKQVAEVDADAADEIATKIKTIAEANKQKAQKEADAAAYKILEEKKAEAEGLAAINAALAAGGKDLIEYTKWAGWNGQMPSTYTVGGSGIDEGIGFGIGNAVGQKSQK
ncbi:coil containing protein [Vibrio phage 2.275.O._10N.286.54.E11]|nr:coil containing protein [Vibrio phage 2.275.O._10N.286.54.E11]